MADSIDDEAQAETVKYLFRHVVLPAQLPHTDDRDVEKDNELLELVTSALEDLKLSVESDQVASIDTAKQLIDNLAQSRDGMGDTSEEQVLWLLNDLTASGSDNVVPLEVKAQNAALLISRDGDDIVFESFELSPTNEASMTKGRLIRHFPALAARVPVPTMRKKELKRSLAATIAKLTTQEVIGFRPVVHKAASIHCEPRDTVNPAMVTEWFMNLIAAVGTTTDVSRITKKTREEVLWQQKQPWRRSPLWLLIRVSLQLFFTRLEPDSQSAPSLYKGFMIHLLSRLQQMVRSLLASNLLRSWY